MLDGEAFRLAQGDNVRGCNSYQTTIHDNQHVIPRSEVTRNPRYMPLKRIVVPGFLIPITSVFGMTGDALRSVRNDTRRSYFHTSWWRWQLSCVILRHDGIGTRNLKYFADLGHQVLKKPLVDSAFTCSIPHMQRSI